MRRWAFLLRPGWLALFVVVIAFAYLCFTVLAPWQLGKNTKTSRENAQISHSLTSDPVPVTTLLPQQDSSAPDDQWRQVTATGHYLPDAQVLARLRVVDGEPAFEVLVPFAVDGGPTVLVDRGYVRPEQGSRVPPIAPPPDGTVTITARLRDSEPVPEGKDPFRQDGAQQVYAINTAQISAVTGVPAGRLISAAGRGSARRPGCYTACRTWTPDRSCPTASSGSRSASSPRSGWVTSWSPRSASADGKRPAKMAPLTAEEKLADRYGRRR